MQTTSTQFTQLAEGAVRPISYALRISFTKEFDDAITFFTLDQSVLDGPDVLGPTDNNPLQEWDKYEYSDYTDRLMNLETSAEVEFPYSVASAVSDFTLNNYDSMFTPNSGSLLAPYVLPSRPLRMFIGFNGENLQQFVGLTEYLPVVDDKSKTVTFHGIDFLSKLFTLKTTSVVSMQNVRTDEVLDALFQSAGLDPSQYDLPKGRNEIAFLYYERGTSMGDIVRKLMQAELGLLYMDELGIIRFVPRNVNATTPVMTFNDTNIIDIKTANAGRIINVVEINATVRAVQENQPIFILSDTVSDEYVIEASSTKDIWSTLEDPATTATEPTAGLSTTDSYFIATDLDGNPVGSVTVSSSQLFVDTYLLTFSNANAFPIRISEMSIWGTPAKIVDKIKYIEKDQASIDKYDERSITIDNDFVQSVSACESIALTILDSYAEYSGDIEMVVKGNPALQIGDYIEVNKDTFTGDYKVTSKVNQVIDGKFGQRIGARRFTDRRFFTLDVDILDGPAVLAP